MKPSNMTPALLDSLIEATRPWGHRHPLEILDDWVDSETGHTPAASMVDALRVSIVGVCSRVRGLHMPDRTQAPNAEHVRLALDLLRVELCPMPGDAVRVGFTITNDYGLTQPVFSFAEMKSPGNHRATEQIAEALELVIGASIQNMLEVKELDDVSTVAEVRAAGYATAELRDEVRADPFDRTRECICRSGIGRRKGAWHTDSDLNLCGWECCQCGGFISLASIGRPSSAIEEDAGAQSASVCAVCHRAAPLIDGECPDCRH